MQDYMKVILIDDDKNARLGTEQTLELAGFNVQSFASAPQAVPQIVPGASLIVVCDVMLRGMDGLELQQRLHHLDPDIPVILITGHGNVNMAVEAMRHGAYDFIEKPFAPDQLLAAVKRAAEKRRLTLELDILQTKLKNKQAIAARILGVSVAVDIVRRNVLDLAETNADVLIVGETGTGKELIARCLHDFSSRRYGRLVAVNGGGLPETLFESEIFGHQPGAFTGAKNKRIGKLEHAHGGTFFLDEIENMPFGLQVKLLRALQERKIERLGSNEVIPIDCRVVAATKVDLHDLCSKGTFRSDLYYRLNVAQVFLPPLRDRREDIPLLFEHFVLDAAMRYGRPAPIVSRSQVGALMSFHWPGNLRELHNAADRFVLGLSDEAFGLVPAEEPLADQVRHFERALIQAELLKNKGDVLAASELLRIPIKTLYDKMQRHSISLEKHRN
jgi:two-component system, NtrC family, C4-dicarboxylate transport response regulator DctD